MTSPQENKQADAQIQAHRLQHQQKMKKIFLVVGAVVCVILLALVVVPLLNQDTAEKDTNSTQVAPLSTSEIDAFRESFKETLTDYELRLQGQVSEMKVIGYAPAETAELALLKQTVLTSFAQGAFSDAKSNLETLVQKTEALIEAWELAFSQQLIRAQEQFEQENMAQAQLNLNKALAIMPNNIDALALQNRINAFGEIEILLQDLDVAKIERNLPKQIDLLGDIISLDPEREALQADLINAKDRLDSQELANALQSAEQAINANNLPLAEKYLAKASSLDASSKGIEALQTRISNIRSEQGLAYIQRSIENAASNDNWQQVSQLSSSGLSQYPNHKSLLSSQQQASAILKASKTLQSYIGRPERLADTNIRENAQQAMLDSFSLSIHSPSLQGQIADLGELLDTYSSPVEVTIQSDEKTYIIVVGIGHVGQHAAKTISLTPGNYVLEGKREGYKSKRLTFTVEANTPLALSLVCDQKI